MTKISNNRMYGTTKIKIQDSYVIVSDKERTLLDLIYFPDPVGSLKKAFEILKYQIKTKKINIKKIIKYTSKFPIVSIRKRIGFILEQECSVEEEILKPLLKSIKGSSLITLYENKSRKGSIDKKWGIIKNDSSR
jgi:predicted transcriptional regulator of viral defense system